MTRVYITSALCRLLVAIMLAAAAGCAGSSSSGRGAESMVNADRPDEPAAAESESAGDDERLAESTEGLIDRAQRDIETWREQMDGQADGEGDDGGQPAERPQIEWSDPEGRAEHGAPRTDEAADDADEADADSAVSSGEEEEGGSDADEADDDEARASAVEDEIDQLVEDLDVDDATSRLIVRLCSELYREGAYEDQPMRQLLLIAAMSLHDPDRALHVDALPSLVDEEREILAAMQEMFVALGRELDADSDPREVIIAALDDVRAQLVEAPQLHLANASLCTEVSGFGRYETFDRNVFLSQSGQQVVLYIEVDDFTTEPDDDGRWLTRLSQKIEIYSSDDGIPVWREDWQTAVDRARNKRQDFYMVQLITIPDRLGVGRYHLKIRMRDELSGAEAETGIDFELVADERMAATEAAR